MTTAPNDAFKFGNFYCYVIFRLMALHVGILTFHRCFNYGTYWQARCLVEQVSTMGCHVHLADHDSAPVAAAERKCGFHPVLPRSNRWSDCFGYGLKMLRFSRAVEALPRSPRFPLDDPSSMPRFDVVIVGSDEVWNFSHPWYGGAPLFFGEGIESSRLISYAASFGNYGAEAGIGPEWSARLRDFDAISVRDCNSQTLVQAATGTRPPLVLDPCLLFPPRPPVQRWRGSEAPFIAVYGHTFTTSFATGIRAAAAELGLPLVSIGYRNDWADHQWLSAGPTDFAQAIARSAAVVTNFFHGCVFALRFERPFVAELSSYRSVKIVDLLQTLGAGDRMVSDPPKVAGLQAMLASPLAPRITARIAELRATSQTYLYSAIS